VSTPEPLENPFGPDNPCFGCSADHPFGLKLKPKFDGQWVTATFTPPLTYQGPRSVMHGGLVTTLADEVAAWAVIAKLGKFGFTVEMQAKLRGAIRIEQAIEARSCIEEETTRMVVVRVELTQNGALKYEGTFRFALVNEQGAERLLGGPVPDAWKRFLRCQG
jgi:acyl-coenzyme A thioesterase PaaI-like protein